MAHGSKRGRRIVWRFLERAGVYRLSFNTNAMAMAFAEGNGTRACGYWRKSTRSALNFMP